MFQKSAAGLMNLPNEVLLMIFKKVDHNTLAKCNCVCKRFQMLVGSISQQELAIFNFPNYRENWFGSADAISDEIKIYNFKPCHSLPFRIWKLKSLVLHGHLDRQVINSLLDNKQYNDFDLSILNQFKLLENLEVHSIHLDEKLRLDLPNLKNFSVFFIYDISEDRLIELFAPKLLNLRSPHSLHKIKVLTRSPTLSLYANLRYQDKLHSIYDLIKTDEFLFPHY